MKTITIKTTFFPKVKLGARRSPEFRIFHHFTPELLGAAQGPQTPGRKGTSLCEVHELLCNPVIVFISHKIPSIY
jgi:hypothetical protein